MERQCDLNTWADLEAAICDLTAANAAAVIPSAGNISHLLFRGHGSHDWPLETTLDRARPTFTLLADYYRIAAIAKTQVETFTSHSWQDIDYASIAKRFEEYGALRLGSLPNYDYLVYLRHHGFPSPLLDWTRSLYIASYFAFQNPIGDRVAIYVYQEYGGQGKSGSSNEPQLHVPGPNVRSHPRHFLQQGEYTLCAQFVDGHWSLGRHAAVFELNKLGQDRLWKYTLPCSEAAVVMDRLEKYNISAFSLFQSEESLLETLSRSLIRGTWRDA
jgi:hypothetical protein